MAKSVITYVSAYTVLPVARVSLTYTRHQVCSKWHERTYMQDHAILTVLSHDDVIHQRCHLGSSKFTTCMARDPGHIQYLTSFVKPPSMVKERPVKVLRY